MQSESETNTNKDLMVVRMNEDTDIWNKIIFKELVQALKENDQLLIEYWRGMFI